MLKLIRSKYFELIYRNNVDDVAVLRNELHNVQSLMMSDINEIKSDTKFDELRQEKESLESELSTITLKLAADSKTHDLEMKYSQEENTRLNGANEKLESRIEDLASTLSSTEQIVALERKKAGEVSILSHFYFFLCSQIINSLSLNMEYDNQKSSTPFRFKMIFNKDPKSFFHPGLNSMI